MQALYTINCSNSKYLPTDHNPPLLELTTSLTKLSPPLSTQFWPESIPDPAIQSGPHAAKKLIKYWFLLSVIFQLFPLAPQRRKPDVVALSRWKLQGWHFCWGILLHGCGGGWEENFRQHYRTLWEEGAASQELSDVWKFSALFLEGGGGGDGDVFRRTRNRKLQPNVETKEMKMDKMSYFITFVIGFPHPSQSERGETGPRRRFVVIIFILKISLNSGPACLS